MFKKFKKFNESFSLSKAARMSSTYLKKKIRFVKIIFIKPLRFVKAHVDLSKDRSSRRTHGYSINLIIKPTVKNKMSLRCSEKEKFLSSFRVLFRLGL